ncbi:MAG: CBS domain-containing protein [Cyanobacteria bacterium P01_C01_bin.120]
MDLVLCHAIADFDTLGAAVGVAVLNPAARIVLAGGCHPTVQAFLALHRDEYPLIERRTVDLATVAKITVVDTQSLERLGAAKDWVVTSAEQGRDVWVYDHHRDRDRTIPATRYMVEPVGAATTILVEQLQAQQRTISPSQATVMALGIHVDTGSLTFTSATVRDAMALAWLMEQGASQAVIAEFVEPNLSPALQALSEQAIAQLQREQQSGQTLGWVLLETADYVPGLSGLAERLLTFLDLDSLLFGAWFTVQADTQKLMLIGRARGGAATSDRSGIDFNQLFSPLGGGGHPTAAAVTYVTPTPQSAFESVLADLRQQIPPVPMAGDLMSSPVRTILPATKIREAQRILLRYGHSGLSVVNREQQLVGIISRRDIDLALHHGFGHAPVKGYMSTQLKTITPQTSLPEIEALMVTYDIGRLPVLAEERLVGVVTRTDVLRQLHQSQPKFAPAAIQTAVAKRPPAPSQLWQTLQQRLDPGLWKMLQTMATVASDRGWQLYLVGGGVRDLFLSDGAAPLNLPDVDLVVDSAYQTLEMGAGVVLAEAIKAQYPQAELQVYGRFQTAALVWHQSPFDAAGNSLMVDIATARTEFYPYPAANPEVEASSIRQDLYRRDFTINALAVALTPPAPGRLLDFFGGLVDLQAHQIRVLHANSFIEDPTRIYRAVRFAVRLDFTLESQTEGFIRHAIASGVYQRLQTEIAQLPALQTRLRAELQYILAADYWEAALALLDELGALVCLHAELKLGDRHWQQLRDLTRWLTQVDLPASLMPWLLRLELLLSTLPAPQRVPVAEQLQLPQTSSQRLQSLASAEAEIAAKLPQGDRPSQHVHLLQTYDLPLLILVGLRQSPAIQERIWRYLTNWSQVKAILSGTDLKALGYPPGPLYREILAALQAATLDGEIQTREEAIARVVQQFPRS